MPAAKPYNGHPSWNAWNVSLWINNDEGLYTLALDCLKRPNNKPSRAASYFISRVDDKTPDGAPYGITNVTRVMKDLAEG